MTTVLACGTPLTLSQDAEGFTLQSNASTRRSQWTLRDSEGLLSLVWRETEHPPDESHVLAALHTAFERAPDKARVALDARSALPSLINRGIAVPVATAQLHVAREALWQHPSLWLPQDTAPQICQFTQTQGRRHPLRPPKPQGELYRRHIPWLGQTLTFRSVRIEEDLPTFNRWMNDPVVAKFWQEEGDQAKHRAYLEGIAADPHVQGLIGCLDEQPFSYFEVYWAKEDRIAPFCDPGNHDRGWHVLVGEARFRGRPFLTAWMPAISHYLFLSDCRTERIFIEPRADNDKMIRSLSRCGYALLKEFDFPHKRAMLGMLLRERFFGEALWIPKQPPSL